MAELKETLQKLDVSNDNHWTATGEPRLETVKFLHGSAVTREEIESGFPDFNKTTAAAYWMTYSPPSDAVVTKEEELPSDDGGAPAPVEKGAGQSSSSPVVEVTKAEPEQVEEEQPSDDGPEDELTKLESAFKEVQSQIATVRAVISEYQTELNDLIIAEGDAYRKLEALRKESNSSSTSSTIRKYLDSQREQMAKRGEARKAISESGVDLKELAKVTQKSPLDVAMARGNRRGGRR